MGVSLKIFICLMTASVSLLSVTGNKEEPDYWKDITETYHTGDTVQIDCHYLDSHESNEKFLCKGENPLDCEKLIQTTGQDRYASKGRFVIRDNKRLKYFYVTIKNMNTADSGTYWCGSDGTSQHAKIRKILLSVAESHTTSTSRPPPDHAKAIIGGAVGGLAFLLIVVVVVLVVRHKFPGIQVCCAAGGSSEPRTNTQHNTEGNHGDHNYEEIQMQNKQASPKDALPTVYATVNPPTDQLLYASVNFPSDSVNVSADGNALPGADRNGSSACDYSSISRTQGAVHPPAAEQTIYTTVTKPREP